MEAADADSDVETLPSDVSSEVELPPAVEPDESLPTIIDGGSASDQCCNQGCLEALAESRSLSRRVLEFPGSQKAETCLSWLYRNVAEDLAESVRLGDEGQPSSATARSLPQLSTSSFLYNLEDEEKGVRWMPPGTTLAEMLDCAITFATLQAFLFHFRHPLSLAMGQAIENQS